MQKNESRLTVFFDGTFWVGVYERGEEGRLEVCRIIFGPEPKDGQVWEYLLRHWHRLRFGPPVKAGPEPEKHVSPKRLQRQIRRQLQPQGVGTRAQQALTLQREQGRQARKEKERRRKDEKSRLQYEARQQKKKQKHKGR